MSPAPETQQFALFDFDGTLTRRDSLACFLKFAFGRGRYYRELARKSPLLLRYLSGQVSNHCAKQRLLGAFIADLSEADFADSCMRFTTSVIPSILRPAAVSRLDWHRQQGHHIAIVSASPEDWIAPWAAPQGMTVIATRLLREQGQLTGRFDGANCHGEEKVRRIQQYFPQIMGNNIYAYGDTSGDLPMLRMARHAYWKPFRRQRLREGLPT